MTAFTTERDNVSYHMLPEYRETYAEGHFTREQTCVVAWNDKDRFLSAILPQVRPDPSVAIEDLEIGAYGAPSGRRAKTSRVFLERKKPQVHPNDETMFAADYEVLQGGGYPVKDLDGQFAFKTLPGNGGGPLNYGKALIKVIWKTLPYRVDINDASTNGIGSSELNRYCSMRTSYAGQNLEIPPGRSPLELVGDTGQGIGVSLPSNIRKPFSEVHVMITWHYVPFVPFAAQFFMGKVNETVVTPPSPIYRSQFRRGTLLYLHPEVSEEYYTFDGRRVVNITYHFLWRDNVDGPANFGMGHNYLLRPTDHRFYRVAKGMFVNNQFKLPVGDAPWPQARFVPAQGNVAEGFQGGNIHDYVQMHNLFCIDSGTVQYT